MQQEQRIRGLDSIRFLLALIVVVYHTGAFPLLTGIDEGSAVGSLVAKWYKSSINGQAAVIAFFVISGFCIHYPFRKGVPNLRRYFPRRLLRTVVPVVALVAGARALHVSMPVLGPSVLWSLICEEVYYFLYPFVTRPLQRKVGWGVLVLVSFVASECLCWAVPKPEGTGGYVVYGWQLNWFHALPCWLLGCLLAEGADALTAPVSRRTVWGWRLAVFVLSGVCEHYRLKLAATHSLNYFAFVVFAWLQQEVRYHRHVRPSGLLEWAGKWSYSLYLTHLVSFVVYDRWYHLPSMGLIPSWFMHLAWILGWSYVFYLAVEKPSHMLARWLGSNKPRPQVAGSGQFFPGPAPLRAAG